MSTFFVYKIEEPKLPTYCESDFMFYLLIYRKILWIYVPVKMNRIIQMEQV